MENGWESAPCKGRRGHGPCGALDWDCRCPYKPTDEYRIEEIGRLVTSLLEELERLTDAAVPPSRPRS